MVWQSFRLDVYESEDACGQANLAVGGASLPEAGQGQIALNGGVMASGQWEADCRDGKKYLRMTIDSIQSRTVENFGAVIGFKQTTPVQILEIAGNASIRVVDTQIPLVEDDVPVPELGITEDELTREDIEFGLYEDLLDLQSLKDMVLDLEHIIDVKRGLLDMMPVPEEEEGNEEGCKGVVCFLKGLFDRIVGLGRPGRGKWPHKGCGNHSHGNHSHHNHTFPPPWWKHPHGNHTHGNHTHGNHSFPHPPPGWKHPHGNHTHGNHTHGNHTFPHPPFRHRPPFFCRPKPPHGKPPHGKPPHGKPPHGKPPHEGPPHWAPPDDGPHRGPSDGRPPYRQYLLAPLLSPEEAYQEQLRLLDAAKILDREKQEVRLPICDLPTVPSNVQKEAQQRKVKFCHGIRPLGKVGILASLLSALVIALHARCRTSRKRGSWAERREARRAACRARRAALRRRWIAFLDRLRPDDEYDEEQGSIPEKAPLFMASSEGTVSEKNQEQNEPYEALLDEKAAAEEQDEEGETMTMSQEISSFQDAALMVSEMVAPKEQ